MEFEPATKEQITELTAKVETTSKDVGDVSFLGTNPRSVTVATSEVTLNVKDFGAKGDSVTKEAVSIQKALDKIKTTGSGKVFIPKGKYLIEKPLQVYQNTTVEIDESAELITDSAGTASNMFINGEFKNIGYSSLYNGDGNITIRGGTINVNQQTRTAISFSHGSSIKIEGVYFKNVVDNHFIELSAVQDVLVTGCSFVNFKNVDTAGRNYVEAIQIDTNTSSAFPAFGAYDNTPVKDVIVEKCYFGSDSTAPTGFGAIATGVGSHGSVNNVWNTGITVRDCVFDGLTYCGVRGAKWNDSLIENNRFYNCARAISFETISGDNQSYKKVVIAGNSLYGCGSASDAIKVTGTSTNKVIGVQIKNNHIENTNSAYNPVSVLYADSLFVESNFSTSARRLLYSYKCTNISLKNNKGNTLGYNAFYISFCDDIAVSENVFSGMGHQGFLIEGCNGGLVHDNILTDCAVDNGAIQLYSVCSNFIIHDNIVKTGVANTLALYGLYLHTDSVNIRHYNNLLKGSTAPINSAVNGQLTLSKPDGTIVNVKVNASNQLVVTQE